MLAMRAVLSLGHHVGMIDDPGHGDHVVTAYDERPGFTL
jgi:hypothetical protein